MRISTAQMAKQGVNSLLDRQTDLAKTQLELATGYKINKPSDDVLGTTQVLALEKVMETHKQYVDNAGLAEHRLQLEETALTQGADLLQRVRELAVQADNPTLTASQRAKLAPEVRELLDGMVGLANTTDADGEYIFAGYNVDTAPIDVVENPAGSGLYDYNYTGDSGQRNIQIGSTRQVAVGDAGDTVFGNVPTTSGTQSIFETLEQFALDLENNTVTGNTPADMKSAIDHFATILSRVGGRLNGIDNQRAVNEDVILQSETTMSDIRDLDYAEAASRMNQQLLGLEAAQKSFARIQSINLFSYL
jgi:flagellar hook-associated protein 3 FlgL